MALFQPGESSFVNGPPIRLGTVLYGKQKAWTFRLQQHGKRRNVSVVAIDLDTPLEEQGEFDLIIHKVVALIADEDVDPLSAKRLHNLETYLATRPTVSLDPMASIRDLCDRFITCQKLDGLCLSKGPGEKLSVPNWLAIRDDTPELEAKDMSTLAAALQGSEDQPPAMAFPMVAKPFIADGNANSHQMALVWDMEGVASVPKPVVLQPFVNHGGYIYKIYILGDHIAQMTRPSLPDMDAASLAEKQGFEYFGRVSNARECGDAKLVSDEGIVYPSHQLIAEAARHVRTRMGITLFGIDLIRDADTQEFLLIDVNYLPGYYGVDNLHEQLLTAVQEIVAHRKQ
mmetsp:Transcript_96511/g.133797  ORF Transcript_96511/g.133797 Transcript_96511/m.133797 type:complete len:343 (+) Transcript_96511:113-1141(+)